jgi:hypothetical protein
MNTETLENAAEEAQLVNQQPITANLQPAPDNNGQQATNLGLVPQQRKELDMGSIAKVDYLTPEEEIALLTNEQIIADEFRSHIDVGLALVDVRTRRLYRMDYGTFTDYYRNKWHLETGRVHYLIGIAEAHQAITTAGDLPKPEYAAQLRPLIGLKVEAVRQAWSLAVQKTGGRKLLPRLVQAAVIELKLRAETQAKQNEVRRERAQRRQELTQTMDQLLELIIMRKPHEELVQKASLLDQHVRFFFPKDRSGKRR